MLTDSFVSALFHEVPKNPCSYDKMKLPQIFLNTVLYFAKDKIVIPVTCNEKLSSTTLGEG